MKAKNKTSSLSINVQVATTRKHLPPAALLKKWCTVVLQQQKVPCAEVCIRIVDGRESAALNKRYRNKSGATNVLSFPAQLPTDVQSTGIGDLVICAPVVERESAAQGKTARAHWAHMVVHGTLHLLGHDHTKRQDASKMEAVEIKILGQLGFDNPYNQAP
jgi:probable rRNA maturation factor